MPRPRTFALLSLLSPLGCLQSNAPPTSLPDQPSPVAATAIVYRSSCISVWDREVDGEWLGLVMFTDTSEILADTMSPGPHAVSMTRWMPSPVNVYEDSISVSGNTALQLPCE